MHDQDALQQVWASKEHEQVWASKEHDEDAGERSFLSVAPEKRRRAVERGKVGAGQGKWGQGKSRNVNSLTAGCAPVRQPKALVLEPRADEGELPRSRADGCVDGVLGAVQVAEF